MNRSHRLISNKVKQHHSGGYNGESLPQIPVQNRPPNYRESSVETGTQLEAENAYTPCLPVEIWLYIINLIQGNIDKLSLSRVSRALRTLVLPSFKTINVFPNKVSTLPGYKELDELNLLLSLRGTQLASVVTSFTIKLTCNPGWKLTRCMCLELDSLMSIAFKAMINLVHLDIHCQMCDRYGEHRYRCFTRISTRSLRSLSFQCYCKSIGLVYSDTSIPTAVLSTLESLRWYCRPSYFAHTPREQISSDSNVLSRLNALVYYGSYREDKLMAARSIRRVWIPDEKGDDAVAFLRALGDDVGESSSIGLTCIILEKFNKLEGMVAAKPGWFRNLQHIGTLPRIHIDSLVTQLESYLAPFCSLPHLKSLDTISFDPTRMWKADSLRTMHIFLKGLRRVLVRRDKCWVWEFSGGYTGEWSTSPGIRTGVQGTVARSIRVSTKCCTENHWHIYFEAWTNYPLIAPTQQAPHLIDNKALGMNRLRRLISNKSKRRHSSACPDDILPEISVQNHHLSNYSEPSLGAGSEFEAEDPDPDENAYTPRLPAEIWLQIINFVQGNGDKLSLSRVSSLFRALVSSSFKTIDLFPNERYTSSGYKTSDDTKLLLSLRGTQLASVVTSFTIKLTCNPGLLLMGITRPSTCMCLDLDDLLSIVFKMMVSLVHLDIDCKIGCPNATHRCLTNISTRKLRSLSFQCYCSVLASLHLVTTLTPGVLATLESLRWRCSPRAPDPRPLDNPNIFEKLDALVYYGNSMEDKLIATRPVRRVWVPDLTPGTEEAFMQALRHNSEGMAPAGLEYVIFTRFLKLGGVVAGHPKRFENLRHIGTLPYIPKDSMVTHIESHLTPFTSLPYLRSLDTASYFGAQVWSLDSLRVMHRLIQALRTVLVRGDTCRVCEFVGTGQWVVREVPSFGCWDIIRGVCN